MLKCIYINLLGSNSSHILHIIGFIENVFLYSRILKQYSMYRNFEINARNNFDATRSV